MSTHYPSGPKGSDLNTGDTFPGGEGSSTLFMSSTISRDVDVTKPEESLLSSLNSKYDSSTLRLNNSHETIQPRPQSHEMRPWSPVGSLHKFPPHSGGGYPEVVSSRPEPPLPTGGPTPGVPPGAMYPPEMVHTVRGTHPPPSLPSRSPSRSPPVALSSLPPPPPPPPPPPGRQQIHNSGFVSGPRRTSWMPPSGRMIRPPGIYYSTVKSSKRSKWRTKLQGNRSVTPGHELPNSSAVHSLPPVGNEVENILGDGEGATDCSFTTQRKEVEVDSLAESLSTLAEKHLKLDVLDQSRDVSNFISYLIDTIQMLEAEVNFKEAGYENSVTESDYDEASVPSASAAPLFRTIHQIYCGNSHHKHDRSLFENEPMASRKSESTLIEASGKIKDLWSYALRHPEFCFIVIKEHTCVRYSTQEVSRLKQQFGPAGLPSERFERLAILSPLLLKGLTQISQYALQSSHNIVESRVGIDAPYVFLFHHRERLAELAHDDAYRSVLSPLQAFLQENYGDEWQEAISMFDQGVVNARHLQKLFQPNHLVIFKNTDNFNVYALEGAPLISKEHIIFTGWSYFYDKVDLRLKPWYTTVSSVGDEDVEISNLEVHPVRFGREEDLEKLTRRGQTLWKMKGQQYTCYTGWDHRHDHYYSSARFMVDLATHRLMHPPKKPEFSFRSQRPNSNVWPMNLKWEDEITPDMILLLPSTVYGFNLQEKKWVDLDVDKFHPITWNRDAFKRLVLEGKTKEMIHALVDIQTATKKMDDIITGKGNGLIVLLHGSPGTGKTLTAESVAEIAEKPLYRVTCGDIGTEAQDVEKYLATVLYLGKLWDCVLLLDEADVFLEERTFADLQRNSLVSVFLRVLEYYEGILILTSNRVGHFDEAFKSRIQVAIHYDNLSKKSRKAIWQNFLDMIQESEDEDANIAELQEHLDQLASEEMNGRQIRNALLTARQLAKHRKERLEWEHLDQVMKTSAAFNKYLKTVRGQSDDKLARDEGRR